MLNRIVTAAILAFPLAAIAQEQPSLETLQAELAELSRRVAALEAENRALRQPASTTVTEQPPPSVAANRQAQGNAGGDERLRFSGDFRYRYEEIDVEGADTRQRTRIRARASVEADAGDDLVLGFGVATGGDAPTSSTQTLGGGGSKKGVALDLAYVDWTPGENLHILAGKFRNPLLQVPSHTLLWDDEWRPEGIALRYRTGRAFATVLGTWLESDTAAAPREWAAGAHAGVHGQAGNARITAGAGYFDFGTAGKGTFYGGDTNFLGNSFRCAEPTDSSSCAYLLDYREVELFAAVDLKRDTFEAGLYGHYLRNLDADRFEDGWTLGARLRTAWQNQPLQFNYFYRSVGADAVYGLLTDSDFGGGGSDAEGHYLKSGWSVNDAWTLSLTLFDNRIGDDAGTGRDYDRVQLNADYRY